MNSLKQYIFDVNRCACAPRYLYFNLKHDGVEDFGQFTTLKIGGDPYYEKRSVTLQSYKTLRTYLSGTSPKTIEYIPTDKIEIINIVDEKDLEREESALTKIINTSDQIYNTDVSFSRGDIKDKTLMLINELLMSLSEYGNIHPTSNYKTMIAYLEQKEATIDNWDSDFTEIEATNREILRDKVSELKDELKRWLIDLIFNSPQN